MRLSSRMAPEPQSGSAMASGVLGGAQLKDRFAVWTGGITHPCHIAAAFAFKTLVLSGLQGHRACEGEKRAQHGKGKGQEPPCSGQLPKLSTTGFCVADTIGASTPACALWGLKAAKDTARWI